MINNDLKELKPIYIHETSYSTEDGISLIDLAIVLINRKKLISLIFIGFIVLGIAAALSTPKKYTYSTSIQIGSQIINASIKSFESPQTLLAKLQHSFIPQALNEHQLSNPLDKNKYKIKASVPKNSDIIILEVKGTEKHSDSIVALLQSVTQKAIQDHNRIFQSVKRSLETSLSQATNNIKSHINSNNNENEITANKNIIEPLTSQLANLRNTREVLPPIRSLNPTSGSRKTIVIVYAFAGIFLGVFAAFFTAFLSKVNQEIDKDEA